MTDLSLIDKIGPSERVAYVAAHWWTDDARLVIIDFEERRSDKKFSLCLDLEKATFIDHAEDSLVDSEVQSKTKDILRTIIDARWPKPSKAPDRRTRS
ncbi:hypothetical protein [Bradyrhizobium ivorense]|uniref:hypothetical protein n=1 Tax=Bradyrhizobium ivorense TaxID=2511166 RepID=UPI0010BB078D|nr:hypothetical protein [Bradyrhizobium ivorense]VIO76097.1 hypothetical protein CI41S_50970 [Bradyrhizobium ivorense]